MTSRKRKPPAAENHRRFVLISDLHLHPWAAFSKGDGESNTRLLQTLTVLSASLARARDLGVPWVFGGDIVHTAGYALNVVMSRLTEVLALYPDVIKLAVWGNHDVRGIGGKIKLGQTVLSTLARAVPNFVVLDPSVDVAEANGLTFSGAGYQPRNEYLDPAEESDVGIYHQTVRGTKTPNGFTLEEGVQGTHMLARHRFVAVGHVHHWQFHEAATKRQGQLLLIPGSPEQHNFGDVGAHGWWIIDVPTSEKADIKAEMIKGGSPEFVTVDSPADVKDDGNFYRVRSVGISSLPGNAQVIGPAPIHVEQRNVLQGARGEQVIDAWLRADPPDDAIDRDRLAVLGRELVSAREAVNLRPYRIVSVKLKNFCSYESADVEIREGTWLVVGKGKDFPSNGAGKSTLFEAIYWTLFGSTTKGLTGDEVIRWGTKECKVVLELWSETDTVTITRARGKASTLQVVLSTHDGSWIDPICEGKSVNDSSEMLQKYLGVTPDLFKALGYFSQEDLVLFASATDGKRKDMLADLIGLGVYQEAATAAGRKTEELGAAEQKVSALRESAQARLQLEHQRFQHAQELSRAWTASKDQRASIAASELTTFDEQREIFRAQMEAEGKATLGRQIAEREQRAIDALYQAEEAAQIPSGQVHTQADFVTANTAAARTLEDLRMLQAQIKEVKSQDATQQRRIEQYHAALSAGKCPTCQQAISAEHRDECLKPEVVIWEQIKERLHALELQLPKLAGQAAQAKLHLQEVAAGVEEGKRVAERRANLMKAQAALLEVGQEKDALDFDVGTHVEQVLEQRRRELVAVVERIKLEVDPHAYEMRGIAARIAEAEAEIAQGSAARTQLLHDIAIYDYWRRGFSKQGVQSLLLDEIAGLFNESRGIIFPALTQGVYDVQFSTLSRTKSGEARERTEFQVFDHGKPVPYNSLSGGQRRRIDVGVMLTLVKAVSRWMQVPGALGALVLDEVFGFLDNSGAEGLMEALREMQEQIPAIFVVSHDSQLQALFPEVITVVQDQQGVSRISSAVA